MTLDEFIEYATKHDRDIPGFVEKLEAFKQYCIAENAINQDFSLDRTLHEWYAENWNWLGMPPGKVNQPVAYGRECIVKQYFGRCITVWRTQEDWHPFPWRFSICDIDGTLRTYCGIPNQTESSRSALKRAWWRAKWMHDGTYNERYSS